MMNQYRRFNRPVIQIHHDVAVQKAIEAIAAFEEGIQKMELGKIPEKSEQIDKISAALVKAQKNIGVAIKDAQNPFFKSKYADLGSVMEACKEALNNQGIAVIQPITSDEHSFYYVTTIFLHETGQFLSGRVKLFLGKNDMQQLGSASSYARRYALQAMGFIPSEDDDANVASMKVVPPGNVDHKNERGRLLDEIKKLRAERNLSVPQVRDYSEKQFGIREITDLPTDKLCKLIELLTSLGRYTPPVTPNTFENFK